MSDVSGGRSLTGSPNPTGPQSLTGAGGQWPESNGVYVHATVPELALPGMPAPSDLPAADHRDHGEAVPVDRKVLDEAGTPAADLAGPWEPSPAAHAESEDTLWPGWPVRSEAVAEPAPPPGPEWVAGPEELATAEAPHATEGALGSYWTGEPDPGDPDDVPWSVSAYEEQTYEGYTYAQEEQPGPPGAVGPEPLLEAEFSPVPLPAAGPDDSMELDDSLEPVPPDGHWEGRGIAAIARGDLIAELAGRLEQLDQLLNRLEEAKRQAADASEHLLLTRRWQEETVRTIQEERARMRQRQHALDELAERARAAVEAMQATYRTLPREVIELAIELQVLDRAGFITRRARRPRT